MKGHSYPFFLLSISCFLFFSLFFFQRQLFTTADLGRHLVNGRIIINSLSIPSTNLYSYTHPNYPTTYHHWLAGVIFYLTHQLAGFNGLTVLFALTNILAVLICLRASMDSLEIKSIRSIRAITILFTLVLAIPLITHRREIRPEIFSYLFFSLYLFILEHHRLRKTTRHLWLFPLVMIFWINTHIYFILGLFLLAPYFLSSLLTHRPPQLTSLPLFKISLLTLAATLINPHSINGVLAPLKLATNLGFSVTESRGAIDFFSQSGYYQYLHFFLISALVGFLIFKAFLSFWNLSKKPTLKSIFSFFFPAKFLLFFFMVLSFYQIRFIPLFGFTFLTFFPDLFNNYLSSLKSRTQQNFNKFSLATCYLLLTAGLFIKGHYYSSWRANFGLGLMPDVTRAGEWLHQNPPAGPIFNTFASGGYLIYYLYPHQLVFTDNRPEAFPPEFFTHTYIPALQSEPAWQQLNSQYHFQTIVLSSQDQSPVSQQFIHNRTVDPAWNLSYQDPHFTIFSVAKP